jgi:acetyl-CoA C-acetyltransferase
VRLVSWSVAGMPLRHGYRSCTRQRPRSRPCCLSLADVDLLELNEAFAAQALVVMREWKFSEADLQRTNVHGSGISLGHPNGATGTPMLGILAREMPRRDVRNELETMCIGAGQDLAVVWELVR